VKPPAKPEVAVDVTKGSGRYTIQIGASPSQTEAESLSRRLRGAGVETYIVKADLGARGIWYRVRSGRFETSAEAQKVGAALRAKGVVDEYVVSVY
jgi:cell division septation protein DedD